MAKKGKSKVKPRKPKRKPVYKPKGYQMSNTVGTGVSRVIVDTDGEAATVTGGRLDVNAELVVGDVNICDVDIN